MTCECLMCLAEGDNSPRLHRAISPTQRAYAMLWRDMGPKSRHVREARAVLLAALTKDQQREAIGWIQTNDPITESEILTLALNAEPG